MISLVFVHYTINVIVNLNVNENHVQYVHSKTDDPPRVTQYTVREIDCMVFYAAFNSISVISRRQLTLFMQVRELSYRKHKNWEKNQCQTSFHVGLE